MTRALRRKGEGRDTKERQLCEDRSGDWSYSVTNQGTPEAMRDERNKEVFFRKASGGSMVLPTL